MHSNRHAKRGSSKQKIWRKRVGVEPTILAAKDRINGFEGHEGHRTPFASDAKIEPLLAATSGSPFATSLRARRTSLASDVKIEPLLAAAPGSPFATSLRARRTPLASDVKIEPPLAATPGSPFATSLRARRTSLASDA